MEKNKLEDEKLEEICGGRTNTIACQPDMTKVYDGLTDRENFPDAGTAGLRFN